MNESILNYPCQWTDCDRGSLSRVTVVIPALNEASSLPLVLSHLPTVFGNRLACWLMCCLFGVKYTDLGPFRAINYPALCSLEMSDQGFGWTIEMQIKASQAGLRTLEIPVPYRCRIGRSKISGTVLGSLKAGAKTLYSIGKYRLQPHRVQVPPSVFALHPIRSPRTVPSWRSWDGTARPLPATCWHWPLCCEAVKPNPC